MECLRRGRGTERGSLWAWWDTGRVYYPRVGWQVCWNTGAGPASKFQVRPTPFRGPTSPCDGARAQTAHNSIPCVFGDGSVRSLGANIAARTWWDLMTPVDGRVVNNFSPRAWAGPGRYPWRHTHDPPRAGGRCPPLTLQDP